MFTHQKGPFRGNRKYGVPVVGTFEVNYNTSGISSGIKVGEIEVKENRPVHVKVWLWIVTAFNAGTTNVLTIGTDSTANQWLAAGDFDEGVTGHRPVSEDPALIEQPTHKEFLLTSTTEIWIKFTQTGTAASAGKAYFFVEVKEVNTDSVV